MKKVFLKAYARLNLGDDLFLHFITSKYPNINFFIYVDDEKYIKGLDKISNLNIIITDNFRDVDYEIYDAVVYIGGSIFIEGENSTKRVEGLESEVDAVIKNNIPFFFIGSNFGPYKTEEYASIVKRILNKVTAISFREMYSFDFFDIDNKIYAPDLLFDFEYQKEKTEEKTIGISVISLEIRNDLKDKSATYYSYLINSIKNYQSQGFKVYLFSFCKREGDCDAIFEMLKSVDVNYVFYDGNIDKFLDIYSKMEYMIAIRFHAMILSLLFKQKIHVLSYSKKLNNVINDCKLFSDFQNISEISKDDYLSLDRFYTISDKKIKELKNDSKNHFNKFEEHLIEENI